MLTTLVKQHAETRLGRHFQGGFRATHNPGLKPWAVLYSRFAAKSDRPLQDGMFVTVSQAVNCLATFIQSLRDDKAQMSRSSSLSILTLIRFQPDGPTKETGGIEVRRVADLL